MKSLKYTVNNSLLTQEQREFYEENGYIIIRKLIDNNLLEQCRQRFVDICNGKVPLERMVLMKEKNLLKSDMTGEFVYYKVQDIIWDEVFSKYVTNPVLLDYVECFTGPNIYVVNSMVMNKPPKSGPHPIHQDLHYFPFRPAEKIVGVWTAVDKAIKENGCLFMLPGTHKAVLQPHPTVEEGINKTYNSLQGFDKVPKLLLPMEKGDTIFFNPLIFHGSGGNNTKECRKAVSCHFASSECYYIDVKGTSSEETAREFEAINQRKGIHMTYQDFWRYMKKRHVRGVKGSLL